MKTTINYLVLGFLIATFNCGDVGPPVPNVVSYNLEIVSGNGQNIAIANEDLELFLVKVTDTSGEPISGIKTQFEVGDGDGYFNTPGNKEITPSTNEQGEAAAILTMSDDFFQVNRVKVRLAENAEVISSPSYVEFSASSTRFRDSRAGQSQVYRVVKLDDGKIWMAENLNFQVDSSWCYDNEPSNCDTFGRLYNWNASSEACPSGWQLPTKEEWDNMIREYDPNWNTEDIPFSSGEPYDDLINGGPSGFAALHSGFRGPNGNFYRLGFDGNYWTLTEQDANLAWRYFFDRNNDNLSRNFVTKSDGYSYRCIKD